MTIVPIRTVFGTGAVLLGLVVAVVAVRNFTGVVLGTGYFFNEILAAFSWSAFLWLHPAWHFVSKNARVDKSDYLFRE